MGLIWAQHNCSRGNHTRVDYLKLIWGSCMYPKEIKCMEIKKWKVCCPTYLIKWLVSRNMSPSILPPSFFTLIPTTSTLQFAMRSEFVTVPLNVMCISEWFTNLTMVFYNTIFQPRQRRRPKWFLRGFILAL
jgi:hypothetical protein